ncbi:hypothetical protein [Oceanobacillus bengalensis]|uniref:Uncharacterized protein n=1 Tax=Oceanobacillus bengalensis TaxID=1435466 RepID=A0A494Z0W3_9BACI|nr:hypothetical protein [Oceanobacillus bengalensis]RKQ16119.1 hypothetical protein D8M05_08450 [Oceanobacillus bengalensis]
MELKTENSNDQANDLRSLIEETIGEQQPLEPIQEDDEQHEDSKKEEKEEKREFDILNLPPRKEVHTINRFTGVKFSAPLIQFLTVIVIIGIILAGAYYYWGEEIMNLF